MPEYTFKHPDASATRQEMQSIVAVFNKGASGEIKVTNYKVGRLVVEADTKTVGDFKAQYPDWELHPVTYADFKSPGTDYRKLIKKPGPGVK